MNKYLFLGQLQAALEKQLSADEVRGAMEYYENYIIEAVDYGRKEEDVLKELGDPVHLAQTVLENLKNEQDLEFANFDADQANSVAEENLEKDMAQMEKDLAEEMKQRSEDHDKEEKETSFSDAFDDLMKSTTQTISDAGKIADVAAGKIAGYFNEYFNDLFSNQSVFDDDSAENRELMGEIESELRMPIDEFENIQLMLANISIKAYFTEDPQLGVKIADNAVGQFSLEVSKADHTLYIREKKSRIYHVFSNVKRQIELFLPLSFKGKLEMDCSNASIQLKGKEKKYPSPISIICDNGSVEIKDAILGMLKVHCDNGKIDLKHVICYHASLKCNNGVIRYDMIENDYAKNISLRANNGLIKINNKRWSSSLMKQVIPARNDSKFELGVDAKCDNGVIRLTGF